jgi:hypothetical protein
MTRVFHKEKLKYSFWHSHYLRAFLLVHAFLLGSASFSVGYYHILLHQCFSCQFCDVAKVVNMCGLLFQLKRGNMYLEVDTVWQAKGVSLRSSQVTSQPDLYRLWILQQLKFELTTERNAWNWLCMPQSLIYKATFTVDKVVHEHWGYPQISLDILMDGVRGLFL